MHTIPVLKRGARDVRKAFEDSLRRIDELIEGMRAERDRIKAEFERRLDTVRFGQVDWERFEELGLQ